MSEVGALKWIEAGLLLAAGVGFGWWQLRGITRAQQASRAEREAAEAKAAKDTQDGPP